MLGVLHKKCFDAYADADPDCSGLPGLYPTFEYRVNIVYLTGSSFKTQKKPHPNNQYPDEADCLLIPRHHNYHFANSY